MIIAVPYENGQVFGHFGKTEAFKVYTASEGLVTGSVISPVLLKGHDALADFLSSLGVTTVICGGIGAPAKARLADKKIQVFPGVSGNADEAVEALLSGTLYYMEGAQCNHHHKGCSGECCHD